MKKTGQCLCGAVSFEATVTSKGIQACHCKQCQRWTGGSPLFVVDVEDVVITGADAVSTYRASTWGERGFCKDCGTTLYWKMQGKPQRSICVGALDDQSDLTVREEIFVDQRADWIAPWHEASQSTQDQEFAKLDAFLADDKA